MEHTYRKNITLGILVDIVQKENQGTKIRTRGIVESILTPSAMHPHGIKVRLSTGHVGRIQEIIKDK